MRVVPGVPLAQRLNLLPARFFPSAFFFIGHEAARTVLIQH